MMIMLVSLVLEHQGSYILLSEFLSIVASRCFSPKLIILLVPPAFQHGPLRPPALKNFFETNVNFKSFQEVNRMIACAGTAPAALGTSGIITFGEKARGFTPKKCLVRRCSSDGSQFLSSGIGMGLDFCHLV